MTTFDTGRQAEKIAAEFLRSRGFAVLMQNWRNRWSEIDIVAERDGIVHFVEVKYRHSSAQGGGIEYVTPKKLRQMEFAAGYWMDENQRESDYYLSAIEVSGKEFEVTNFIKSVTS